MNYLDANASEMSAAPGSSSASSLNLPVLPVAVAAALCAAVIAAAMFSVFPVFTPPEELLAPMPPEEIAQKREATYALHRLLNPIVALAPFAFLVAIVVPGALIASGKASKGNIKLLLPLAILAAVLTCIGLALGHLVLELEVTKSLGLGRTFLARWLELGFLAAGVGAAVGAAVGGSNLAMRLAVNSAIIGVLCALVLDLIFVPMTGSKVDVLVPGGIIFQSTKDPLALGLFFTAIVVSIAFGCTKELSKPK